MGLAPSQARGVPLTRAMGRRELPPVANSRVSLGEPGARLFFSGPWFPCIMRRLFQKKSLPTHSFSSRPTSQASPQASEPLERGLENVRGGGRVSLPTNYL